MKEKWSCSVLLNAVLINMTFENTGFHSEDGIQRRPAYG